MFCKSCGAKMEDNHVVCQMCGTKKGEGRAFCENCGSVRQYGMAFCQECGFKFVDVESSEPAQTTAPYAQQTPAQQFQSGSQQDQSQYMPEKKFCRGCGAQVMNTDKICSKCGVKVGEGKAFCPHCAAPIPSPDASVCVTCGKPLKEAFDVASYGKKFADNFTNIFKDNDVLSIILDWGSYLASFVIFILSFLPTCYVSVSLFGISSSESFSVWFSPFAGFLFLLAFLVSIARFVPHVDDFIKSNEVLNRFAVFAVPGLSLIALGLVTISILSGAAAGFSASNAYASAGAGFTFWGILLIIFVLASVAAAVFSFLRKEGKVKF